MMRIVVVFIIIGILFSYVPVFSMDECPEGNHMGNMKMDCGSNFHCPLIFNIPMPEPLPLPISGRVVLTTPLLKNDELAYLIFRPPKHGLQKSIHGGKEFL